MQRRALINLVLFGVASILGGLAYLDVTRTGVSDQPSLTPLRPESIAEIRIRDNKDKDILLVREEGRWRMRQPYQVPAAAERIGQLLGIATTPVRRSFPARDADLPGYGLAPAELHLDLDGVGIDFGATEPIRFRRYVRLGAEVGLIDDGFQHHLIAPAEDFVSRRVVPEGARVDPARSRVRPLDLDLLIELTADSVTPLKGQPEGVELEIGVWDAERPLPLILAPDRRQLARPDLGLAYGFREPLPLRPPPPTNP